MGPPGARAHSVGSGCAHLLAAWTGHSRPGAACVAGRVVHEAVGAAHGAVVLQPAATGSVAGGCQLQVAFRQEAAGKMRGRWGRGWRQEVPHTTGSAWGASPLAHVCGYMNSLGLLHLRHGVWWAAFAH